MIIDNIVITGRIYKEIQTIFEGKKLEKNFRFLHEDDVTVDDLHWADAFASFKPSPVFELTNIKWVHSFGAGVDSFLHQRDWNNNVLLTRTICSFGQKIGEYCLSYILKDLQFHHEFESLQNQKEWRQIAPKPLHEQTVIIYGTGMIGQEVAKLFDTLGMTVYGVSLSGKQKEFFKKVYPIASDVTPLKKANFVINTLPLTDFTNKIFNEKIFNALAAAIFINVGRGATVDENSLLKALDQRNLKHAILDVFSHEPLHKTNPLWNRKDVTITPHISAITSPEEAVQCFIDTLTTIENNNPLKNLVDSKKGF
ncbi:D-2-hydroxyacid dehydrogenase [Neobacillus sp. PS3-40]|uniref:D-2-hydroxyacid dehydrogenase n=1 Tax=Neobacillus sp. PS3-40 TaxID=3070679 RepID=UPI0027E0275B|nr:D-2-hydroxyacid dehydrogenase [Neobacillus sp. PS3-40]WML44422.1 D-2-hydroxyacid dehydrogenase [Neobacillus sp. PS3-40]